MNGLYISKLFFVNNWEKVQVNINSDVPAYDINSPGEGNTGGLEIGLVQEQSEMSVSGAVTSYNSNRTQNGFTTELVYSLDTSGTTGDYYLVIKNASLNNCNCQVTVSIVN